MTSKQGNEIKRLLIRHGLEADVLEREGWPAVKDLTSDEAEDVITWLKGLRPGEVERGPRTEPDEPRKQAPGPRGELLVERKFGVWTCRAFFKDGQMEIDLHRYAGGPDNEYRRFVPADEDAARGLAGQEIERSLRSVGAII